MTEQARTNSRLYRRSVQVRNAVPARSVASAATRKKTVPAHDDGGAIIAALSTALGIAGGS